ncbi:MAG: hypothetical protein JW720_12690 [Sedimentisphaerales bacterium]|nr:hypothetical protein [Sedimentisphaerales bacterium]
MNIAYNRNNGSVLAFALLVLVILLITGLGFMSLSVHSQLLSIRTATEIAARTAADAGITNAVFRMNEKLKSIPWDASYLPVATDHFLPNCNAAFSYSLSGTIDAGYTIESVGKSINAVRTVNALIQKQSPYDYAIMVKETINLKSGTLVTGYDSSAPTSTDLEVDIGSTSPDPRNITLSPGAVVNGDVLIDCDYDFMDIVAPIFPPKPAIVVKGATRTILPADSGTYPAINVADSAGIPGIIEIDGGNVIMHVTGSINLGQGAELVIKKGSSLTLYLGGDLISRNSTGINNETEIPAAFRLYGTANATQTIDLKAKTNLYGVIYAPNAAVIVRAESDTYGSVTANSFEMKNSGTVYYDVSLRKLGKMYFGITRWWEN